MKRKISKKYLKQLVVFLNSLDFRIQCVRQDETGNFEFGHKNDQGTIIWFNHSQEPKSVYRLIEIFDLIKEWKEYKISKLGIFEKLIEYKSCFHPNLYEELGCLIEYMEHMAND